MTRRFALFVFAVTSPLAAQTSGSIRGTITDSSIGHAVVRATAWLSSHDARATRAARADSLGSFVFDSLAPGRYRLSVQCASRPTLGWTHHIWEGNIEISAGQNLTRAFKVGATDCDQRPLLSVAGEFRGFYENGFEHSRFIPCPVPAAGPQSLLSAISKPGVWVWAEFRRRGVPRSWPDGEQTSGIRRWYVQWRGTIRGPDRYGHLGGAQYEAVVDTFLTIRHPNASDCA